jgi:hypothetical protein
MSIENLAVPNNYQLILNGTFNGTVNGQPALAPPINFYSGTSGAYVDSGNVFQVFASKLSSNMIGVTISSALTVNAVATDTLNLTTVLPIGYRPGSGFNAPCAIFLNGGYVNCIFVVLSTGEMLLRKFTGSFANTDTGIVLVNYFMLFPVN